MGTLDLEELLHRNAISCFDRPSCCWRFSTLCEILTEERIRAALAEIWPEDREAVGRLVDNITPLYYTNQDAREKRPIQTSEPPPRFLKIFAILVLIRKTEEIKNFIESNVTDRDLPLEMKGPNGWGRSGRPLPACFGGWRPRDLAQFHDYQSRVNVSDYELRSSEAHGHLDVSDPEDDDQQRLGGGNVSAIDIFPWRVVTGNSRQPFNTRACEVIRHVEIDPECEHFQDLLRKAALPCRYFAVKTISRRHHRLKDDIHMLKRYARFRHSHLVPLLSIFESGTGYHMIFPLEEVDIQEYWKRHPTLLGDAGTADVGKLQWVSEQIVGIVSAVDWLHSREHRSELPAKRGRFSPDEVLWFSSELDPKGALAIADFALPCEHGVLQSSSWRPTPPAGKSRDYLTPEAIYANYKLSDSRDIWTLGCFLLDMACWVFGGSRALEKFVGIRKSPTVFGRPVAESATFFDICYENETTEESGAEFFMCDTYFQSRAKDQTGEVADFVFRVHPAVAKYITALHTHATCTEYMHDLLDLVESQMLLVNPAKRAPSGDIVSALQSIHSKACGSGGVEYLSKPCPRPRSESSTAPGEDTVNHRFSKQTLAHRPFNPRLATQIHSLGLMRTISDQEIRILYLLPGEAEAEIKCTVRVVPLSTTGEYEALSYVWGESSGSIPIQVRNREVKVTGNLHAALRQLRNPTTTRTLWIDQLCVNQWDEKEKAEQVQLMRHIYERCSQCIIWLGELPTRPESGFTLADARMALSFITDMSNALTHPLSTPPPLLGDGPSADAARRAFRAMFMHGNAWWSRIWTVQEAILPPSSTIAWGSLTIPWDTLRKAAANMCAESPSLTFSSTAVRRAVSGHRALVDSFMYPVRGLEISREGESPLHMLQRWRYRDATEPRDKLYAVMGLFPAIPGVECSYSTPTSELFTSLTLGLIKMEGSLRPFVGFRGEPHVTPGIPSWALDLARYDYGIQRPWKWWNHSHRYDKFAASGDRMPDFDGKFARGVFMDTVAEVGDVLGRETWDDLSDETLIRTVRSWEDLLEQFMASKQSSIKGPYAGGGSVDDAFWRTMLGNLIMAEFPVSVVSDPDRVAYDAFLEHSKRNQVNESLWDMVVNQAFFITTGGYIGIGPPNVENGDEVWVLYGGNVPFLLRRQPGGGGLLPFETDPRSFLGDAYVHGIMHGVVVESRGHTATRVRLV